jgi:hypothetical protein
MHHAIMSQTTPHAGEEEDPEYGFREPGQTDDARAFVGLQRLLNELSDLRASQATVETALERVCEHVMRDPVYTESTRAAFRTTLELLRARAA